MTAAADIAIRLARATFNRAIAACDLAAIEPLLARDAVLITGSDSAVIAGRKAQMVAWKREFVSAQRMIYTRTPGRITPSPVEPVAMEDGSWQGVAADSGQVLASGCYSAKWREVNGAWRIEAEIFVTLA